MKIALGTTNKDKIKYVKDFFGTTDLKFSICPIAVNSGVDDQPIELDKIKKGAQNRAKLARESTKGFGVGMGLEGGLIEDGGHSLMCITSIYNGVEYYNGQSDPIKLPHKASKQIERGSQFGEVIRQFNCDKEDFCESAHKELISRQKSFSLALSRAYENFITNRPYRIGAIAYIFDGDNKILIDQLTSYAYEDWNFPGGGRDEGETASDNILRELKEELNIKKSDLKLIAQTKDPIKYDFPKEMLDVQHVAAIRHKGQIKDQFIFKFVGDKNIIKANPKELRSFKWVNVADLKKYLTFPNQYEISIGTINRYLKETK